MRTILLIVARFLAAVLVWGTASAAYAANIAPLATVTASSENTSGGQTAVKAVDGVADGYPGDKTREWRTATKTKQVGAWLSLVWGSAYLVDRVVLYDRPNGNDQITSATLTFSDGSSVLVGTLSNDGSATTIEFGARVTTSLLMTVTGVSGTTLNVGLAEIEVYGSPAGSNQPPSANAGSDQSVTDGTNVTLSGSGNDPENGPLSYQWTQTAGPAVTLVDATQASASFTAPAVASTTVLTFQLTVTDNQSATGSDAVDVTVEPAGPPPNQAPSANAGTDQAVGQGVLAQLNGTGSLDPEGQTLTYQWTQTAGPSVVLGNATTATPSFTTPSGLSQNTTLTFELVVNDGVLNSTPDSVNVTVLVQTGSNIAPLATVTASSENTSGGQTAVKAVDGVADGYPGDKTREWRTATKTKQVGAWLSLVWGSAYLVDRVVLYDRPNGNDQITSATLTFSDGSSVLVGTLSNDGSATTIEFGARVTTSLLMTVTGVSGTTLNVGLAEIEVYGSPAGSNQPPSANAGSDQSVTDGTNVTLSGSGNDPENGPLSYQWTQTAGPAVTLVDATQASASFTAPAVASTTVLTFQLTVTDNQSATGSDAVDVTVEPAGPPPNQAPSANAGTDQAVGQGVLAQLNGTGSLDPEGQTLTYQWTQTAGPSVVLGNATTATPSFTTPSGLSQNTTLTFELVVNDGVLNSTPDSVNVTVLVQTGSNIAPLATVTASSENTSGGQTAVKAVDGVADGYPGDKTREWRTATKTKQVGAWLSLVWGSAYLVDRVVLYDRPNGNDQITSATLTFSDGSSVLVGTLSNDGSATTIEFGARVTTSLLMTVTGVSGTTLNVGLAEIEVYGSPAGSNQPPSANAGSDQSVSQGTNVVLNGSGTDPEGGPLTYQWSQTAGPAVTLVNANQANASFTAPTVATATVVTFQLTVTDNQSATGSDAVSVTVEPSAGDQPPVASNTCTSTPAGNPISNGALTAVDPEGQVLTFDLVANGNKGFATVFSDGNFTYTPNTNLPSGDGNARGQDKFVFRATDPSGHSATGTVTVLIDGSVRIMPLGDSITEGVSNDQPIVGQRVGYRRKLYNDLTVLANGAYSVDFVGQRSEGFSASPPIGDANHQGIPGERDDEVAAKVIGYLNATPTDIVLLHIGTNDFNTSATDVQNILNNIDTWESANYPVTVFLARIIDDVPGFGTERDVTAFNNNLASMVASRPSDRVILVDMQNGAGLDYGSGAPGPDMDDNIHPKYDPDESDGTPVGYAKIASKWYQDMTNLVNVGPKYSGLPQCQ